MCGWVVGSEAQFLPWSRSLVETGPAGLSRLERNLVSAGLVCRPWLSVCFLDLHTPWCTLLLVLHLIPRSNITQIFCYAVFWKFSSLAFSILDLWTRFGLFCERYKVTFHLPPTQPLANDYIKPWFFWKSHVLAIPFSVLTIHLAPALIYKAFPLWVLLSSFVPAKILMYACPDSLGCHW